MKRIKYSSIFEKKYTQNIKKDPRLLNAVKQAVTIFKQNPFDESLNNHALKGKMIGLRAFWVLGDIRIIYKERENYYIFLDIGSHSEVYIK